ncbi:uncharacterized protein PFL1_03760 [Pseudozyma flocculosa PF-1]|uniref:HECT-type E3 ubiquitin transferase n=2 Tax=Pseudozyma flocculosa TaxID=84751 RepID=A0A5C3EVT4_9BASI|nr:uncharacterized protein PFL1_03760 [Pseudozyma flocculosa PF-1]EPQ28457.1 hypothetical protein PFL1_03760 [Pseudozyma flocculosa PF-1]SPO36374.1 related to UFD4 - Ubiquitin-protein ligase (E3) [Pseudozyma flocculosa]
MKVDGEKSKPQPARSLRARKSSDTRLTQPQQASSPLKPSDTTRSPDSSRGAAPSKRKTASTAALPAPTPATSSRIRAVDSPVSEHSSQGSHADGSYSRSLSPLSAPATPATNLSIASTTHSSSARSAGKKAHRADVTDKSAPTSAGDASGAFSASLPGPTNKAKGKGKAKEPSTPPKQTGSPATRSTRSAAATTATVASGSKASTSKKRSAETIAPQATDRQSASKRQKQSSQDGGPYNLRSKDSSASSSRVKTSKMAPRKGSGDFSLTRGSGGAGSQPGSVTPAAKGKGKAKGGRPTRAKAFRDPDDVECADDDLDRICDGDAIDAADQGFHDDGEDDDVEMVDVQDSTSPARNQTSADCEGREGSDRRSKGDQQRDDVAADEEDDGGHDDDFATIEDEDDEAAERFEDEDDDEGDDDEDDPYGDVRDDGGSAAFGLNLRAMAGYMSGLTGRFRTLLASLKDASDPTTQLVSLQELSELLSVSTEDTLAGYFPTEAFVKELVHIMGGPKPGDARVTGDSGGQLHEADGDAEMAAAIAAAAAADFEEDNGEKMLLACRCLANLIEAMPYTAHSVVSNGAIPVLTSKLMEITFIDLAEQVLQTLEKVSQEFPSAIVKEGGLTAILQYLDFFNIHIQRTAMTAAANCCRKLSAEAFPKVKEVMPTIQNVLGYSDQRLVESACKCVVRTVESYRHQPDLLEQLLTSELLSAINGLLLPASAGGQGGSNTSLGSNTYTDVLKALGTACRASPKVAVALLENNIVDVLYHLLTGSAPPSDGTDEKVTGAASAVRAMDLESANATAGGAEAAAVAVVPDDQGTVAVADMAVLQNLAQRPKEQVQEALSLIGELLPPLPRDGVFDTRAYSEKAYLRRKAQEAKNRKKETASSSAKEVDAAGSKAEGVTADGDSSASASASAADEPSERSEVSPSNSAGSSPSAKADKPRSDREAAKEAAQAARVRLLQGREVAVERFTHLILPTLVEVYAASVAQHVRSKAINGILKILSFVEPEPLGRALDNVPLAGFVAAILSTRDHPQLVHGALQIVELLTIKLPHIYTALLRREGVMWEIESIAAQEPTQRRSSRKTAEAPGKDAAAKSEPAKATPTSLSLPSGASGASVRNGGAAAVEEALASAGLARLIGGGSASLGPASGTASRGQSQAQSLADSADANIWRARMLSHKFSRDAASSDGAKQAVQALDRIQLLVRRLDVEGDKDETVAQTTIDEITALFLKPDEPISSFELLRSGLVEGLYAFATKPSADGLSLDQRRSMLVKSLMRVDSAGTTAASVLVRRLQDSLSRLENVDITTALSGSSDDSRRSATSMLGRQLRLRLVAEDPANEIPRTCSNIVVTIHAVATFQSLNDYLRPKIASASASTASGGAGATGPSATSRLSSVLAAFAAATGSGAFPDLSDRTALTSTARTAQSAASRDQEAAEGEGSQSKQDASDSPSKKASPRRSSRLNKDAEAADPSAKQDREPGSSTSTVANTKKEKTAAGSDSVGGSATGATGQGSRDSATGETRGASDDARAMAERLFGEAAEGESDEALARRLMDGLLHDGFEDEDGLSDEDFDDEILQNEIAADGASGLLDDGGEAADKTINLDVDKEAGQVVAKTPDGTKVPSPRDGSTTPGPSTAASGSGSPSKASYASALQKKPSDWHLEFSLDSQPLSLDTTIYGAIHHFETSPARSGPGAGAANSKYIWGNVYTVRYKKVAGPAPKAQDEGTPEPSGAGSVAIELPPSVKPDAPYAKLLQLLAVLHDLNGDWREAHDLGVETEITPTGSASALPESAFVNNKLTAKLNRQLEEPMIVASSCLPDWSTQLPKVFPFLFPFEARFSFLQSTAFGYARLITRWQNLHSRSQDSTSSSLRMDDSFGFLARLQRQKVRISRSSLLPSAFKVLELYGSTSSVLEVEYFEEVGTGLGPTLEFYSLVSKEFARKDLRLWRDDDATGTHTEFVRSAKGLFPAPFDAAQLESAESRKRIHSFKILGQFVAKALLDSRIIDCNFSPVFLRAVLNQPMAASLNTMSAVDPALARSLRSMQGMSAEDVAGLALDFTVPGHPDMELHAGGRDESVDASNLDRYVAEVLEASLGSGIKPAVRAFRQGFNLIFPIAAMSSFTAEELAMLFGNTDEDWSEATLMSSIKPDHGLNAESASFKDVVAIMASFSVSERRNFLQWLTGSPKLPIGGFAGLHPQLTVVKRPHEPPLTADDYLPSVMTCVNYLKMPLYSSRETMRRRLEVAMKEGSTSFHLS